MKPKLQRTYTPKPGDLSHDWFVVDATDVPLGRLASNVAQILRGFTDQLEEASTLEFAAKTLSNSEGRECGRVEVISAGLDNEITLQLMREMAEIALYEGECHAGEKQDSRDVINGMRRRALAALAKAQNYIPIQGED